MPFKSEKINKFILLSYNTLFEMTKADCYEFLELLATMPKSVYSNDFYKIHRELDFFRDIPLNKDIKKYEYDQENAYK